MLDRLRSWWKHLGYSAGRRSPDGTLRTWGVRPWRGAPFFWFIVERGEAQHAQSDAHVAECDECQGREVPTVSEVKQRKRKAQHIRNVTYHHVCTDGLAMLDEHGQPHCFQCDEVLRKDRSA